MDELLEDTKVRLHKALNLANISLVEPFKSYTSGSVSLVLDAVSPSGTPLILKVYTAVRENSHQQRNEVEALKELSPFAPAVYSSGDGFLVMSRSTGVESGDHSRNLRHVFNLYRGVRSRLTQLDTGGLTIRSAKRHIDEFLCDSHPREEVMAVRTLGSRNLRYLFDAADNVVLSYGDFIDKNILSHSEDPTLPLHVIDPLITFAPLGYDLARYVAWSRSGPSLAESAAEFVDIMLENKWDVTNFLSLTAALTATEFGGGRSCKGTT